MKKILFSIALVCATLTAFGQTTLVVGPYPRGKVALETVKNETVEAAMSRILLMDSTEIVEIVGKFDESPVYIGKSTKLTSILNRLYGDERIVPISDFAKNHGKKFVVFPSESSSVCEVVLTFKKSATAPAFVTVAKETVYSVTHDTVHSVGDTSKPFILWGRTQIGIGYVANFRPGLYTPRGPSGFIRIHTKIGVKADFGFFGWGAYEDNAGLSGYLNLAYPLIGNENEGLDITAGMSVTSFLLKDGRNKIAPDRNVMIANIMASNDSRATVRNNIERIMVPTIQVGYERPGNDGFEGRNIYSYRALVLKLYANAIPDQQGRGFAIPSPRLSFSSPP